MTQEEVEKYWLPAREGLAPGRYSGYGSSRILASLLGIPYPEPEHMMQIHLTDDLKRILQALGGPHRQTVRKILEIKRGVNGQKTSGENLQEVG